MPVTLSQVKTSNALITASDIPRVSVWTGATSGIGKATLGALIEKKAPIKAYIIGRNGSQHAPFLEELRQTNPQAELIWLEAQVSLLADVKRICAELTRREKGIDLLFLAAGLLPLSGRAETSEGHELSQATNYLTRILFMTLLLPQLNAAATSGEFAPRVISIFAAGMETTRVFADDVPLMQPGHWSLAGAMKQQATLNTVGMARLAVQHPGIVFIHNHPGEVRTSVITNGLGDSWWGLGRVLGLAIGVVSYAVPRYMSAAASGQRSLWLVTSAAFGGAGTKAEGKRGLTIDGTEKGALFCVNDKLECISQAEILGELRRNKDGEVLWEKTQGVLRPYL